MFFSMNLEKLTFKFGYIYFKKCKDYKTALKFEIKVFLAILAILGYLSVLGYSGGTALIPGCIQ